MSSSRTTSVSRNVNAPADIIYRAYLDPQAVATWLPPGEMHGIVHEFDAREGGAFSMSLIYPEDTSSQGKSSDDTDTFKGRFAKLVPGREIVWATVFDSDDTSFRGEMTVQTLLRPTRTGTDVTITCENIPPGIRLEDNETGCRDTLEKLAAYVGG
jgi:uncharacterized protein YndB with AHSA1/START domain